MVNRPKYLIRPDDYMVFSLNEDGETYSTHRSKIQWPNNLHHKYTTSRLLAANFFPCEEKDLPRIEQLSKEYYKNQNTKYDGHGD